MAWRRPADKPLSQPMVVSLLTQLFNPFGAELCWQNTWLSSILFLNRCLHQRTRKFYRTIALCMLDSLCKMYHLSIYLRLSDLSLFCIWILFPKDKIISFYQFHVLYNTFGHMNTLCQLCCFSRYLYFILWYVFHFSECLCECVCVCHIFLCMNELCMYVFIVGK